MTDNKDIKPSHIHWRVEVLEGEIVISAIWVQGDYTETLKLPLSVIDARGLAAMLVQAADELDEARQAMLEAAADGE